MSSRIEVAPLAWMDTAQVQPEKRPLDPSMSDRVLVRWANGRVAVAWMEFYPNGTVRQWIVPGGAVPTSHQVEGTQWMPIPGDPPVHAHPPKWDRQRCSEEFLRLINGMELRREPSRPDVNLWDGLVNGERVTLFEQELKPGIVWCQSKHVWKLFADHFSPVRAEVQALLKDLLEEHLKWRVETTAQLRDTLDTALEEHLKWRVETTSSFDGHTTLCWKSTSNGG